MPPSFDKPVFATYQCDDFGPRWFQVQVGGYIRFSQNINNLELRCWGEEPDPLQEVGSMESEDTEAAETNKEIREEPWDHIMPELPPPSLDELLARLARLRLDIFVKLPINPILAASGRQWISPVSLIACWPENNFPIQ
jgi:hypothetical protein